MQGDKVPQGVWTRLEATDTKADCERRIKPLVEPLKRLKSPSGGVIELFDTGAVERDSSTRIIRAFRFECWPDTIDPRK
jgi:hypothetical protein